MNRKIGFISSIVMSCSVAVFAICLLIALFAQNAFTENLVDEKILQAFSFTSAGSWLFDLDLLGYGLLSVSTFFIGLTLQTEYKIDKALKLLLMLHGVFFVCMFVPILPLPASNQGSGGTVALICWCLFFLPICILSVLHFKRLSDNN